MRIYKHNLEKDHKNRHKKNKRDKENNIILQIFCLCNLGLHKEVRHFLLLFILLPFKDFIYCLSLRELLKQLEKMTEFTRKFWRNIVLGSPKDKKLQVNKLVQFPFLTLKGGSRGTFCNNIKKCHHNKRSLPRNRF